ncbi:MAG: hypothetical protein ACI8WT_002581 [Clostridium sp.]|jgi:hypothetical protein
MEIARTGEPSAFSFFRGIILKIKYSSLIESKFVRFSIIKMFFGINILCTANVVESISSIEIASIPIPFKLKFDSHLADSTLKEGKPS